MKDEMTSYDTEEPQIRFARLAGFMYLFVDAADSFGLFSSVRLKS
jgi:hypothetical protein